MFRNNSTYSCKVTWLSSEIVSWNSCCHNNILELSWVVPVQFSSMKKTCLKLLHMPLSAVMLVLQVNPLFYSIEQLSSKTTRPKTVSNFHLTLPQRLVTTSIIKLLLLFKSRSDDLCTFYRSYNLLPKNFCPPNIGNSKKTMKTTVSHETQMLCQYLTTTAKIKPLTIKLTSASFRLCFSAQSFAAVIS